jgi:hypothetical protein
VVPIWKRNFRGKRKKRRLFLKTVSIKLLEINGFLSAQNLCGAFVPVWNHALRFLPSRLESRKTDRILTGRIGHEDVLGGLGGGGATKWVFGLGDPG